MGPWHKKVKNPWSRGNVIDYRGFEGCTAFMCLTLNLLAPTTVGARINP